MSLFAEINRLKADLDALRPLAPEQEQRVLQKLRLVYFARPTQSLKPNQPARLK